MEKKDVSVTYTCSTHYLEKNSKLFFSLQNFAGRNTFLVAMSPDKSTIEEFWSLVDDLKIKTVVMLTENSSACYKVTEFVLSFLLIFKRR